MAPSEEVSLTGYSLLELEAGLSTSSLAMSCTSESTENDDSATKDSDTMLETGKLSSSLPVCHLYTDHLQVAQPSGEPSFRGAPNAAPQNFGLVVPGVYRSSYPQARNFKFLQGLKLKTIVTLVQKEMPEGFQLFMEGNGIRHVVFDMAGTKKADIPLAMIRSIIGLIADETNHPMLVHCNQGKHRTGCVVGVFRMYHGWDTDLALEEYEKYAYPKVRLTDVHYLRGFQLANLRHVAVRRPRLEHQNPSLSVGHLVFMYFIAILALLIWILTIYGVVSFPLYNQSRRTKTSGTQT